MDLTMSREDATLIRELASRDEVPFGTDSESQYKILKEYIDNFQKSLDHDHEVGMLLANFGQNILLNVTFVDYEYPSLVIFKGTIGGRAATLIQNINQLNFLLQAVPKDPNLPKRTIGFASHAE